MDLCSLSTHRTEPIYRLRATQCIEITLQCLNIHAQKCSCVALVLLAQLALAIHATFITGVDIVVDGETCHLLAYFDNPDSDSNDFQDYFQYVVHVHTTSKHVETSNLERPHCCTLYQHLV